MTQSLSSLSPVPTPDSSGVSFGRSSDGVLVALVGDHAFAMMPIREGRHYLASGWRISRPISEWRRDDFYGHGGDLADEAAFRAKVLEQAEHQHDEAALGRREIPFSAHTPRGPSQGATVYADGMIFHFTAGHGGFHLSADRNAQVHPMLRASDAFYEEDECWAIVAITFPDLFTAFERSSAERTVKDSFPDAWEAIFGVILGPGESRTKDRQAFEAKHAGDWVVVSAITSDQQPGFVECVAVQGGQRGEGAQERRFLVASAEYNVGHFGFVIDPTAMQPTMARPASSVGKGGRGDTAARHPKPAVATGRSASPDPAAARSDRSADHPPHDGGDPKARAEEYHLSTRQAPRIRRRFLSATALNWRRSQPSASPKSMPCRNGCHDRIG